MVVVLVPALLVGSSRGVFLTRLSLWRPLTWLGDVSFSVYLWHFPIQIFFALMVAYGAPLNYASYRSFAAFVCATYVVGHLSWKHLEQPLQRAAGASMMGRWFLR
jgi:peptidoglycan/LPS O-acetylase OafA/YrhL